MALQHLRSGTADKRPTPGAMSDGQLAINTNATSTGLFFKDSAGALVKVGPVHIGTTAPNATPATGGEAGNSVGEQWLDTSGGGYSLKIWDGSAWRSEAGEFVNASGDTMTGALVMDNQQQVRFRETTANGTNYIALQAPASVASDKTITLPDVTGTVVTTGDTGSITSTMIADSTIVDGDISASAEIAVSKLADGAARQLLQTDAAGTGVEWTNNVDVPGTLDVTSTATFDSIISASAGAAATPSIAFTGDTNTGIYSPGADQLAISTNGTGRLFVDSDGDVGVGTSSPSSFTNFRYISVNGTTGSILNLRSNDATQFEIGTTNAIGTISAVTNIPIAFSTNNTERLRITSDGKLGLGTSSASTRLHVRSATDDATPIIRAQSNNATQHVDLGFYYINYDNGATSAPLEFQIDGSTKMALSSTGLGIGTTSPDSGLVLTVGATNGYPVMGFQNSGTTYGDIGWQTGLGMILGARSTTPLLFYTNGSERARIDSSGRLLVGTSSALNVEPFVSAQVHNEARYGYASIYRANDASGPAFYFIKSRAASAPTVVQSGDVLGEIRFQGADGGDYETPGGTIKCEVDGTPGANDMPGRLVFSTTADGASSPTERMRITSAGIQRVFSSSDNTIEAAISAAAGTTENLYAGRYSATGTNTGTLCFVVRSNGNVLNTNNSYGSLSDIKLKENIIDANSQWDDLKALQVRNYNFKEGQTHTQIGLIAQEVELVSPGLVSESPDRDADGNDLGTVTKSVNYSVLYMKAVKALQEAMERIEVLEQRLTDAGIA